ncbi:MAG: hypothetical protein ACU84Q_01420 [Gammaproteobacteria bacterium]
MVSAVSSVVGNLQIWGRLVAAKPPLLMELVVERQGFWHVYLGVPGAGVVVVSLYFMYDVIRRAQSIDADA